MDTSHPESPIQDVPVELSEVLRSVAGSLDTVVGLLEGIQHEIRQQALGDERLWTLEEAARLLGVSSRTIRNRIHDRRTLLESRHMGGKQVITHRALLAYVASLPDRPLRTRGGRPRKRSASREG